MKRLLMAAQSGARPYPVAGSGRFDDSSSQLLWTPGSAGDRRTFTYRCMIKRVQAGNPDRLLSAYNSSSNRTHLAFSSDKIVAYGVRSGSLRMNLRTSAAFADPRAWYDVLFFVDAPNGDGRIYVNGVQQALEDDLLGDDDYILNYGTQHEIGRYNGARNLDGYMAENCFVDGAALTPDFFGRFDGNGEWRAVDPRDTVQAWGANGFYLRGGDVASGTDSSGNGNDWSASNVDDSGDSPTVNACTWNPLDNVDDAILSEGARFVDTGNSPDGPVGGTIEVDSGKWYFEFTPVDVGGTVAIGVLDASTTRTSTKLGLHPGGYAYRSNGTKRGDGGSIDSYGASFSVGDVVGVALDLDAGELSFYKNGVAQGVAFTGLSGAFVPAISDSSTSSDIRGTAAFLADEWAHAAPADHRAITAEAAGAPLLALLS